VIKHYSKRDLMNIRGGFTIFPNVFMEEERLSWTEKAVLIGIISRLENKREVWAKVSLRELSRITKLPKRSVARAITSLIEKGFVEKKSGRGRRSNLYAIRRR